MTIKTPAEVAAELYPDHTNMAQVEIYREAAVRAIEADRAQRAEPVEIATGGISLTVVFGEPTATREQVAEAYSAWYNATDDDDAEELEIEEREALLGYAGVTFK